MLDPSKNVLRDLPVTPREKKRGLTMTQICWQGGPRGEIEFKGKVIFVFAFVPNNETRTTYRLVCFNLLFHGLSSVFPRSVSAFDDLGRGC